MKNVYITGGAMTRFGKHPGVLAPELAQQAILKAMSDAGVTQKDIQAIYCANVLGGMILGQLIVRDGQLSTMPVAARYAWPSEMDLMAQLAGLDLAERWADWHRTAFGSSATQHVSVYERP